jgi:hypothetical protein
MLHTNQADAGQFWRLPIPLGDAASHQEGLAGRLASRDDGRKGRLTAAAAAAAVAAVAAAGLSRHPAAPVTRAAVSC